MDRRSALRRIESTSEGESEDEAGGEMEVEATESARESVVGSAEAGAEAGGGGGWVASAAGADEVGVGECSSWLPLSQRWSPRAWSWTVENAS